MAQEDAEKMSIDGQVARPSIIAAPFAQRGDTSRWQVLTDDAKNTLSAISEMIVLPPHAVLYTKGSAADFVYNIVDGAVATYEVFSDGTRSVSAFLFPHDLVGLSEHGRYVATAETLNEVRLYKIALDSLTQVLREDSQLSVGLLLKVCHDLRDAQHHAIVVSHNVAHRRLAGFLLWLSDALRMRNAADDATALPTLSIVPPMNRHDIADYLGLSAESVSRALQLLEADGAIRRRGPRMIDILDRDKLLALSARQ